ncbi:MAG: hypothetical protein AB1403_25550, partial [Candidatus Riflebacteria bacterium]
MKRKALVFLYWVICLAGSACSPATTPRPAEPASAATQSQTPIPPTSTVTPTVPPLPPVVSAKEQANCYSGPGENGYNLIATFENGDQMDVVGRDSSGTYWIVMDKNSNKGCWVESRYISIQGEVGALPNLIPPPTTVSRPDAPGGIEITYTCEKTRPSRERAVYHIAITITWIDASNNEKGFEIYKEGKLWQTFEANSTEAKEDL